jgi:hypothetical protein
MSSINLCFASQISTASAVKRLAQALHKVLARRAELRACGPGRVGHASAAAVQQAILANPASRRASPASTFRNRARNHRHVCAQAMQHREDLRVPRPACRRSRNAADLGGGLLLGRASRGPVPPSAPAPAAPAAASAGGARGGGGAAAAAAFLSEPQNLYF